MKTLKQIIQENFKFKINRDTKVYEYQPKSWEELRQIIVDKYEELDPGTEQEPIDFNDIDISGIITFYNYSSDAGLFEGTPFEYIDISNWDISNIKDINHMFYKCKILKSVGDLSNWNVSNVENMSCMFWDCTNLKSIGDLSNWDISNVEDMRYMFDNSGIKNIPSWYEE